MKIFSRDLFYLVLLVMLVKVAISNRTGAPAATAPESHNPSLIVQAPAEASLNTMGVSADTAPAQSTALGTVSAPHAADPAMDLKHMPSEPAVAHELTASAMPITQRSLSDYDFSDLEENLLLQIDAAQKQVDALIPHIKDTSEQAAHLRSLKQKLAHLRHAYQQSLAAPLFGPQAPIANETSTQQLLEKELLNVVNKLGFIVHTLEFKGQEFTPADSVIKALQSNHGLIEKVIS